MGKKYDLVIVGAGPAGLMAAKVAAENGLKTALLERKAGITDINRVDGGMINAINEYTFGQTLTFSPQSKRLGFPVLGFSVRYDGPHQDCYGFEIWSPGGKRIVFGDREKQKKDPFRGRRAVAIDKGILLKCLLEDAEAAGVEVFPVTVAIGVEKRKDSVVVETEEGEAFEGLFVIAADGVNSRIVRTMGMNKYRKFYATHRAYEWGFEGLEIPHIEGITFVLTMDGTFSVVNQCKKGLYHVGVMGYNPKVDLKAQLHKFVYEDKIYSQWFKGGKKVSTHTCVINMFTSIKEPFKDNVILAGDAAWLMEFSNMAAIMSGWKAANAVTLAIIDGKINKEGISSYLEFWNKVFYESHGQSEFKPLDIQDFLNASDIDYLFTLIKEPLFPTLDFFKLFNTIGNTFGGLFPVIQEERPDVYEKLMGVVEGMEEAEAEVRSAGFPSL